MTNFQILLKIHRKWKPIVSISLVEDDSTIHRILEFQFKEMEIISKQTYAVSVINVDRNLVSMFQKYQCFAKNRAEFPGFVKKSNDKDYQKHFRDCPELKKMLSNCIGTGPAAG